MTQNLTRELFTYLAELARMNVKQVSRMDGWRTTEIGQPVLMLADVPVNSSVRAAVGGNSRSEPGTFLEIRVDR